MTMDVDFGEETVRVFMVDVLEDPYKDEDLWKRIKFIFLVKKSDRDFVKRFDIRYMYGDENCDDDRVQRFSEPKSEDKQTTDELIGMALDALKEKGFVLSEPSECDDSMFRDAEREWEALDMMYR